MNMPPFGLSLAPESRLRLNRAVFDWCLGSANREIARAQPEQAARWAAIAAECANSFGCRQLASDDLENLLLELATALPVPDRRCSEIPSNRWLHVFTRVSSTGGHTALVTRWIESEAKGARHSIALTHLDSASVPELIGAVTQTGGSVFALGDISNLIDRATQLRKVAYLEADYVVLHIHMWDVVPTIAFGVPGGPPVLLLNHADHLFWVGGAVADRVIHLRASGEDVTRRLRKIDRSLYLPIPIPLRHAPKCREAVRRELGIPPEAPVMLTIGAPYKYEPMGYLDFLASLERIIVRNPAAWLIAVGPSGSHREWSIASGRSGGHIIAVGEKHCLEKYHAAADIYLEGFPFGSLTALLEAALSGLPCVRAPAACFPPFSSDGKALENVPVSHDIEAYEARVTSLLRDSAMRRRTGDELATSVRLEHCVPAWSQHLRALKASVPPSHDTFRRNAIPPIAEAIERYWMPFQLSRMTVHPLNFAISRALRFELDISVQPTTWLRCRSFPLARYGCTSYPHLLFVVFGLYVMRMKRTLMARLLMTPHRWRALFGHLYARHIGWRFEKPSD